MFSIPRVSSPLSFGNLLANLSSFYLHLAWRLINDSKPFTVRKEQFGKFLSLFFIFYHCLTLSLCFLHLLSLKCFLLLFPIKIALPSFETLEKIQTLLLVFYFFTWMIILCSFIWNPKEKENYGFVSILEACVCLFRKLWSWRKHQ